MNTTALAPTLTRLGIVVAMAAAALLALRTLPTADEGAATATPSAFAVSGGVVPDDAAAVPQQASDTYVHAGARVMDEEPAAAH